MYKILVVDDLTSVRMHIRNLLGEDFDVIEAANGLQALEKLRDHTPDLVLTDIVMPEMEGLEMIREIRKNHPQTPIIAMTAAQDTVYLKIAQRLGATSGLAKPFTREALLAQIHRVLQNGTFRSHKSGEF